MANITYGGPIRSKAGGTFGGMDLVKNNEPFLQPRWRHTVIPTASVLALNGTPYEILPVVGAANRVMFTGCMVYQDYAGVAYNDDGSNEDLVVQIGGGGADLSNTVDSAGLDEAGDFLVWLEPLHAGAAATLASITDMTNENASIELSINGSDLITGTSDWDVIIFYVLFPTAGLEGLS